MNNYEAVYNDHLARIASEKGEKYAEFVKEAVVVLTSGELIIEAVQLEKRKSVCEIMKGVMSLAVEGLAAKFGISGENNIIAAIKECRELLTSVVSSADIPSCEVH
jgi:hypothetical protein